MKSVTLTNKIREEILNSVMKQWKEMNPIPDVDKAEHDFAMHIWNGYFKKEKALLETIPTNFLRKTDSVSVTINGEVQRLFFMHSKEYNHPDAIEMPCDWSSYNPPVLKQLNDSNKEYKKYKKVKDEHEEWLERGKEVKSESNTILYSVNTTRQLLEVWKECEPFLPAHVADPKAIRLPAIPTSRLNERLGLTGDK